MSVKARDVYRWIDEFAPFALAEEWDNVGILAGTSDSETKIVLCALDLNFAVLEEAKQKGADMIVTHHPIMFRGRKNLCEDSAEGKLLCELIRAGITLIAAHTNFDNAQPGVNNALADRLELKDVTAFENGMRVGTPAQRTLGALSEFISEKIGAPVRRYGEPDRAVKRLALLGGAGGDFCAEAIDAGADVYLTGEVAHHKAWDAYMNGLCVLEGGHAATELPGVAFLAAQIEEKAKNEGREVRVCVSEAEMFR